MKTVAELAKELNISTQAIYKKINKSLKAELSSHVETVSGQRVVDEQGIIIIKTSLQPVASEVANQQKQLQAGNAENGITANDNTVANHLQPVADTLQTNTNMVANLENENSLLRENIDFYRKQFEIAQDELNKEREHSRQQADRLANLAEQLAELSRNNQILLGAEQTRTNPALLMGDTSPSETLQAEGTAPIKKKSFWSLFKKNS